MIPVAWIPLAWRTVPQDDGRPSLVADAYVSFPDVVGDLGIDAVITWAPGRFRWTVYVDRMVGRMRRPLPTRTGTEPTMDAAKAAADAAARAAVGEHAATIPAGR